MAGFPEAGLRLALYARVSTEEQREGQTIDSQVAELERFARGKGWLLIGTYKDEGWSGGVMARPDLDRLRDDAQKGLFDAVLINDVDRLARDVAHLGVIKRDLEKEGIKVIFRKLPSDTSPTYNLMVNILGSFAEFEREMIADRTRRGRRHKVEMRQQYLGSNTSYGYRYIPKDRAAGKEGILEVIPEETAVVRQMFDWVDREGLSARRVMLRLNELRITPRKGSDKWGKSSVLRILRNEMYAGVWHYNKFQGCEPKNPTAIQRYRKNSKGSVRRRPKSEWLPLILPESLTIVPRDRWDRVQRQLDRNFSFSPRNEKHVYLLKGLVRCGACGARYVGDPNHGKFYYRCLARCKKLPIVRESLLDNSVIQAVENLLINPDMILEPLRRMELAEDGDRLRRGETLAKVDKAAHQVEEEESRILEAYRTGIISPAQLAQQMENLNIRRNALELEKSTLSPVRIASHAALDIAVKDHCAEAAKNFANFTHEKLRSFLQAVIHTITFLGTELSIQGRIPILVAGAETGGTVDLPISFSERTDCDHDNKPSWSQSGQGKCEFDSTKLNKVSAFPYSFHLAAEILRPTPEVPQRDTLGRFRAKQ